MLKRSGDTRGFTAKVADFGLSVRMDHLETHMSNVFQVWEEWVFSCLSLGMAAGIYEVQGHLSFTSTL